MTGNSNFDTPGNWAVSGYTTNTVPGAGDDVIFDTVATPPPIGMPGGTPSVDCNNMHGPTSGSYSSVQLIGGYTGTVTLSSGFTTENLNLSADAAIAQASSGTDITITGHFNWTKGALGESSPGATTPSNQNVNINGSGTITMPTNGTLYCGSTLNFNNPTAAAVETIISGAGTLLQNGGAGIFVTADAKVKVVVVQASPNAIKGVDNTLRVLTLTGNAEWGYIGNGTAELDNKVINNGGRFYLGGANAGEGQVTLKVNTPDELTYAYTQDQAANQTTKLEIKNGCVLDVSGSKGVLIDGGQVWLTGNSDLTVAQQFATIKGTFTMTGGSIGFLTPTVATNGTIWGAFHVQGNVNWSGGTFTPGLGCGPTVPAGSNQWIVSGTMDIITTGSVKPSITPAPIGGNPAAGSQWDVIVLNPNSPNAKIVGGTPSISGWTLSAEFAANGTDKKLWRIKK